MEKFVGISGNRDGIPHLPDGEFQPPMEMNVIEKHLQKSMAQNYTDRQLIISRTANLSKAIGDRGPCQYRDMCARGCAFAGYFSSNSATLPAASATGNLTIHPFAVVHQILYDESRQKAIGVSVIDTQTKAVTEYYAKIIFVNAGTLNTTLLFLNSKSSRFPNGFGNDSGVLGHYLMDHNYRGHINAQHSGFEDKYTYGRRPNGVYIPRFRNVNKDVQKNYIRGFAIAAGGSRWAQYSPKATIGAEYKDELSEPGTWGIWMNGMGECLPYYENKVQLSSTQKDAWGMPELEIDCEYKDNELAMLKDILSSGSEILDKAGFTGIQAYDSNQVPGQGIHEMGTARMGRDPKTSVLNGNNQVWGAKNVFVTDGACMVSTACQNPSLTYMALTARAVDFAVSELKKQNL